MKNQIVWKILGIFLLGLIVFYFNWNYFHRINSNSLVTENQPSTQEKTKAEICFQEVSQNECYGSCLEVECPGEVCPEKIQQAYCICMNGVYEEKTCSVKGVRYGGISFEAFRRGFYYGINKKEGTPVSWVHSAVGTKSEGWYTTGK